MGSCLLKRGIPDALTAATVSFPTGSTAYMTSNLVSTNSSESIINGKYFKNLLKFFLLNKDFYRSRFINGQ